MTRDIFKEYLNAVFLPYLRTTRDSLHLQDFDAVLLCDNCSYHIDDEIKALLGSNRVRLVTLPPHASHLFQPLDLVTFGVFKRHKREVSVSLSKGSQVWQITKLMRAFEHATDSTNNRSAFKRAGLLVKPRIFPPVAMVNSRELHARIDATTLPEDATVVSGGERSGNHHGRSIAPVFGFINAADFRDT